MITIEPLWPGIAPFTKIKFFSLMISTRRPFFSVHSCCSCPTDHGQTNLPWFGGSAAVWATCMVFFQVTLLAGYAYADWTTRRMSPSSGAKKHHRAAHRQPRADARSDPGRKLEAQRRGEPERAHPRDAGGCLASTPLMLASTSPLIQAWFSPSLCRHPSYRLFALSTRASLAALLAYPVTGTLDHDASPVDRLVDRLRVLRRPLRHRSRIGTALQHGGGCAGDLRTAQRTGDTGRDSGLAPTRSTQLLWLVLAALGSLMLVAVTNQSITPERRLIRPVDHPARRPLLATFIFAFDHPRWYLRKFFTAATAIALPVMAFCVRLPRTRLCGTGVFRRPLRRLHVLPWRVRLGQAAGPSGP